ncbi:6-bladed beta-propeller [Aquiflexum lacus]|uniref:6-bladed beta-propeller n=1 Tax=Aquiflexum lacus TaxID=2483805 RepID=UPI0018948A36|nr:6-bladed beta-propeller [Aquiflexum lacus]
MKYSNLILLVLSFSLLQNCGNKDHVDTKVSINTIEIRKDFLLGDSLGLQIEILDTINLEAPGNPPLTAIQDIVFSENFILLSDRVHGLLKFDNNGSFLGKIGEKGEGPDEYTMPYAIHLDEKENVVFVADWQKMTVISYNLEGKFESTSNKLPGHPISFYIENDTLLVVQETLNGTKEKPRQVVISSIEPKTLEIENWERPLYGYHSNYTIIHPILRIISRVNNAILFYMPIIRGDISSHSDTDTIFRMEEDYLVPEYLLHFTGFDNTLQLGISQVVMSDKNAFLHVVYDYRSFFIVIDLENNRPLIHLRQLFDQEMTHEMIPKPLNKDVFYSIHRNEDGIEEKNPLIVMYRLPSLRN